MMAKKSDTAQMVSKYAEDWMPVKNIMNGMIQLDNGQYVTGVKIAPKNIFIMDAGVQQNTIYNLRNMYNAIDYEFWLIVADRPVDIGVYLSTLQIAYNNATNGVTRKLIMEDINKANMFMSQEYNVVDTEYYILFKEKKMEIIQKRIHNLISQLAACGLQSTQTSNSDLRMIIDNFFNGGSQTGFGTVMPQ
jgi:hypothetical protein